MTDQELVLQLTPAIESVLWAGVGSGVALAFLGLFLSGMIKSHFRLFWRFWRLRRIKARRLGWGTSSNTFPLSQIGKTHGYGKD